MNAMKRELVLDKIYNLVAENPKDILLIKDRYITDDLWIFAIRLDASLFCKVKNPSIKVCYAGLESDGMNLKYVKRAGYEITPKMAVTAVKSNPASIFLVPKHMVTDDLIEFACNLDSSLMKEFKLREAYLNNKIKENPSNIQYMNPTEEQQIMAIRLDPYICTYIKDPSPNVLKALYEVSPEIYHLRFKTEVELTDE